MTGQLFLRFRDLERVEKPDLTAQLQDELAAKQQKRKERERELQERREWAALVIDAEELFPVEEMTRPYTIRELYEAEMAQARKRKPPGQRLIDRRCVRCDAKFRTASPYVRTCKGCRRLEDYADGENDLSTP